MRLSPQQFSIMLNQDSCSYNPETKTLTVPYWGKDFKGHDVVITKEAATLEKDGKKVDDVEFDYCKKSLIDEVHKCNS